MAKTVKADPPVADSLKKDYWAPLIKELVKVKLPKPPKESK